MLRTRQLKLNQESYTLYTGLFVHTASNESPSTSSKNSFTCEGGIETRREGPAPHVASGGADRTSGDVSPAQ